MLKPMLIRPFDPSNFIDVRETPLTSNLRCFLLAPLLTNAGCALITKENIYFQPANDIVSTVSAKANKTIHKITMEREMLQLLEMIVKLCKAQM